MTIYFFFQACADKKIRFMIDAEQTYIQSALGYIILLLQMKYNQGVPVVYGTYQCYRKVRCFSYFCETIVLVLLDTDKSRPLQGITNQNAE